MFTAFLIPTGLRRPPGKLDELALPAMKDRLRKQLVRRGLGHVAVIGSIDFSFNEDAEHRWSSHWQPHWQLAVTGCSERDLIGALKAHFPADDAAPRPIYTSAIQDPIEQLSYLLKPFFSRRVSYIDDQGQANTRNAPLKPQQLTEIAVFMAQYEMTDRLFLQNVRRYGARLVPNASIVREA